MVGPDGDRIVRLAEGFDLDDVATPLSALSFWFAIALPLLYLPMLAAGIESARGLVLFLGLFGLHVLALVGGHGHNDVPGG